MENCKESDWKLFRVKILEWQERYMDKLNHKLAKLLLDEKQFELTQSVERKSHNTGRFERV